MNDFDKIEQERKIQSTARAYKLRGLSRYTFTIVLAAVGLLLVAFRPEYAPDYWRVFVLGMGVFIVGFASRIVVINYKISKSITGASALLPLHIMAIATSYIAYCLSLHIWTLMRFGVDAFFWYGLPLITVGDIIGIFALGVIWRFQEVRRKAAGF